MRGNGIDVRVNVAVDVPLHDHAPALQGHLHRWQACSRCCAAGRTRSCLRLLGGVDVVTHHAAVALHGLRALHLAYSSRSTGRGCVC